MKIAIGSDHAGYTYKQAIIQLLTELGHEVKDFGTNSEMTVDYPAFIRPVAEAVHPAWFSHGIGLDPWAPAARTPSKDSNRSAGRPTRPSPR